MPVFLNNIDLNLNELQNVKIHNLGSDPGSPATGQMWFNTGSSLLKFYNGSATVVVYPAATANTGSTVVLRDGSGNFTAGTITAGTVTGLSSPSGSSDAANKAYVDAAVNGLDWKASVRAASTADVTVSSAPSSLDGVTLSTNDRVLLKNQSTGSQNGIYVFNGAGSALTRATDCDANAEVTAGLSVWVTEGTSNADTGWVLTTNDAITVGSTSLTFVQFGSSSGYSFTAPLDQSGNTISILYTARLTNNGGSLDLATVGTAGTYTSVTTNAYGQVTAGTDIITSNGLVARTSSGTFAARTLTGTTNRVTVTNGDGVSGNPIIDISSSYAGQNTIVTVGTIGTGTWQGTAVGIAYGGTGQGSATAGFNALSPITTLGDLIYGSGTNTSVRLAGNTTTTKKFLTQTGDGTNSAAPGWNTISLTDLPSGTVKSYATDVGDGSSTAITITHNLGTRDITVSLRDNSSPYAHFLCDVESTTTNTAILRFAVAPTTNKYRVTVHG